MSSDVHPLVVIVGLVLVAIFIFPPLVDWYIESNAMLARTAENIAETGVHMADQVCKAQKIIDEIDTRLSTLPEEVIKNYPTKTWEDAKVKVILEKYNDGIELSQNEYLTLAKDLNKYHKLKTKIYDLERLCDIKEILE